MGGYRPASDSHAIEEAVVGVRLFNAVKDDTFATATDVAAKLAHEHNLPGRVKLDPLSFVVGRQAISPGITEPTLAPGMLFQRVSDDGSMEEELTLERGAVTYRTRSYKRWDDVKGLLKGIVYPVLTALMSGGSEIGVIELRCIDKFISNISDSKPKLNELIQEQSCFLPPQLALSDQLLHIHQGWFEYEGTKSRILVNLNVDLTDNEDEVLRSARILQVLSYQALSDSDVDHDLKSENSLLSKFHELHLRNKAILGALITTDMQKQISLEGSSGIPLI